MTMKEETIEHAIGEGLLQVIDVHHANAAIDFINENEPDFIQFNEWIEEQCRQMMSLYDISRDDINLKGCEFTPSQGYSWCPVSPVREEKKNKYGSEGFTISIQEDKDDKVHYIQKVSNFRMGLSQVRPLSLIYYAIWNVKKDVLSKNDALRQLEMIKSFLITQNFHEKQINKRVDGVKELLESAKEEPLPLQTIPKLKGDSPYLRAEEDYLKRSRIGQQIVEWNEIRTDKTKQWRVDNATLQIRLNLIVDGLKRQPSWIERKLKKMVVLT